jgi:hypothetical protein
VWRQECNWWRGLEEVSSPKKLEAKGMQVCRYVGVVKLQEREEEEEAGRKELCL